MAVVDRIENAFFISIIPFEFCSVITNIIQMLHNEKALFRIIMGHFRDKSFPIKKMVSYESKWVVSFCDYNIGISLANATSGRDV